MPRKPMDKDSDLMTRADMNAKLDELRAEIAANHDKLGRGLKDQLDSTVESFRLGTRDFGRSVDSRFSFAYSRMTRMCEALDALEERTTVRGRWRKLRRFRLRRTLRVWRERFTDWREDRANERLAQRMRGGE